MRSLYFILVSYQFMTISGYLAQDFDCLFLSSYPRQYVTYKTSDASIVIDGRLDEKSWEEVEFTSYFVDISTETEPKYKTQAKVRWDDVYLYVGALIEEPNIWANITSTCHCVDANEDQVIYHDNDFEVFVDPDGSTHFYKEFETNALNATWDLLLNKPYTDGGYENSSRVYGSSGFDMEPPLKSSTFIKGVVNDPSAKNFLWSVEIALPLADLAYNETVTIPPSHGTYWRINFSRVVSRP